ncbi:MAG: peptidylprolyl isomerase [Chloroflexi bacterium]|jgi:peptidylprolyl isomerase|nr:peptidylprolyl isomerase [Chloroflexota bacterium]
MIEAQFGDTIMVHYVGTLDDGSRFDSSTASSPLVFKVGEGDVIPGFEEAVIGMRPGESKSIRIPMEEGCGPRDEGKVGMVPRDELPPDVDPEPGLMIQVNHPDGNVEVITIVNVSETTVVLDANHPLAGKDLNYEIELLEIF